MDFTPESDQGSDMVLSSTPYDLTSMQMPTVSRQALDLSTPYEKEEEQALEGLESRSPSPIRESTSFLARIHVE